MPNFGDFPDISIHAAREGGDKTRGCRVVFMFKFQSTPPVKAATVEKRKAMTPHEFQSTPPVKAATLFFCLALLLLLFQSTPPVKAATGMRRCYATRTKISIHAAREGGDTDSPDKAQYQKISIHAAREGGDGK